jgi:hypothetical protein
MKRKESKAAHKAERGVDEVTAEVAAVSVNDVELDESFTKLYGDLPLVCSKVMTDKIYKVGDVIFSILVTGRVSCFLWCILCIICAYPCFFYCAAFSNASLAHYLVHSLVSSFVQPSLMHFLRIPLRILLFSN